ncbi:unnamed protein product, partial [Vitis vinifera]
MDRFDSAKAAHEKVGTSYDGALISVVDKKMKEHTDTFLHVVDALITRLSQLESRTRNIESYVDELKASTEYNHGRTNGKLKQLENTLREVQGGIHDLRDKQEIVEAQLQLAKLQVSKGKLQAENQISATQAQIVQGISSTAPQQTHQPLLVPVSSAVQLPTQVPQNQISFSHPGSYYLPHPPAPGTTHQQCQIPPAPQSQLPPSVPHQPYQPAPQLQPSQLPQLPHVPPHLSAVNPQVPPSGHPIKEIPYMSSQSYPPSFHQPPFRPPSSVPSTQQFYKGSTLKMDEEPPSRPNSEFPTGYGTPPAYAHLSDFYARSGSNSYSNDSTMKPLQFSPLASVPSGGTSYTQLPTAQILPHALPTASTTVRKLTENGQSADLNVVLDKLMNDGEDQAQTVWFTR